MSKKENDALLTIFAQLLKADRTFLLQSARILKKGSINDKDRAFMVRLLDRLAKEIPEPRVLIAGGAA